MEHLWNDIWLVIYGNDEETFIQWISICFFLSFFSKLVFVCLKKNKSLNAEIEFNFGHHSWAHNFSFIWFLFVLMLLGHRHHCRSMIAFSKHKIRLIFIDETFIFVSSYSIPVTHHNEWGTELIYRTGRIIKQQKKKKFYVY